MKSIAPEIYTAADEELDFLNIQIYGEWMTGNKRDCLDLCLKSGSVAEHARNHNLKGKYHGHLAMAYRHFEQYDQSILEYVAAISHFERAGNDDYLARAENNLGHTLIEAGNPAEAHEHLDRAERYFKLTQSELSLALNWDVRAKAYLAQGLHRKALYYAAAATTYLSDAPLSDTERDCHLPEALVTLRAVLDALKNEPEEEKIRQALADSKGSLTKAAKVLGLHYQGLDYKIEHQYPHLKHLRKPRRVRRKAQVIEMAEANEREM